MRLLLLASLLLFSCGRQADNRQSADAVIDTAAVLNEGSKITQAAFQTLSANLQQALDEGGVDHALQFCTVEALPLTDSLSTHFGVTLRRASHKPRNPANRADSLEFTSIQEYLRQIEQSQELTPNIYTTENNIIYHAPIRIPGQLCLNCHGRPGSDISEMNLKVINQLYPSDRATGFKQGDLRGIWSIRFPNDYFDTAQTGKTE